MGKRIVAARRRSSESRAAFGRRYGIPVHRLYYWITKAGARRPVTDLLPDRWRELYGAASLP